MGSGATENVVGEELLQSIELLVMLVLLSLFPDLTVQSTSLSIQSTDLSVQSTDLSVQSPFDGEIKSVKKFIVLNCIPSGNFCVLLFFVRLLPLDPVWSEHLRSPKPNDFKLDVRC